MNGKQIVILTETIRFTSVSLIVFWLYDFKIRRGTGVSQSFYCVILGILILMIGILLFFIFQNRTNRFEIHKQNIKQERVQYVSKILIFPLIAMVLFGSDYGLKFKNVSENFSEIPFDVDTIKAKEMMKHHYFASEDSFVIKKYKKLTVLLKPHKATQEVSWKESKFGGYPNMESFSAYPKCDICQTPLNFVLQLYKDDFPEFYFPDKSNIFQLFRCPNNNCKIAYKNSSYDHKMFHYYAKVDRKINKIFAKSTTVSSQIESEVPDCFLKPVRLNDFPDYYDYEEEDLAKLSEGFRMDLADEFLDEFLTQPFTKLGGYPAFIQDPFYPTCKCGRIKHFLFQLSSEDPENEGRSYENNGNWSAHKIMIGDAGNIYYYICTHCGEKSIESYWDCS